MSSRTISASDVGITVGILLFAVCFTIALAHHQECKRCRGIADTGGYVERPLYDRAHDVLPCITGLRWLVHVIPIIVFAVTVLSLPMYYTLRLVRLYAILLVLRALVFWVTMVPAPRSGCGPYTVLGIYVGGCSDMMFSGHTILMVLSLLFVIRYGSCGMCVTYLMGAVVLFGTTLLLLTRHHYTSDVLMGIVVAALASITYDNIII